MLHRPGTLVKPASPEDIVAPHALRPKGVSSAGGEAVTEVPRVVFDRGKPDGRGCGRVHEAWSGERSPRGRTLYSLGDVLVCGAACPLPAEDAS